jgi:hypothetical protein
MVKSPEKNYSSQAREAKTTDENSSPRRERSVRLSLPELQEASVLDMFEHSTRTVSTRNMDSLHSLPSLAYYDGSLSDDDDDDMAAIEVVPHRRSLTSNPGGSRKDKGLRCSTASQKTVPCSNRTENDEVCCDEESGDKDLSTLGKFRKVCGDLINHAMVQHAIILLICLNALMMGIATFDFVEDDEHVSRVFEIADTIFLITFTIESAMQLTYHGVNLFKDGWLVFDFTVVVLSWSLESFQIVRAFRIFRTLRLVARLESLRKIVSALGNVIPSLSAVLFLLILVMYIFGKFSFTFTRTPLLSPRLRSSLTRVFGLSFPEQRSSVPNFLANCHSRTTTLGPWTLPCFLSLT